MIGFNALLRDENIEPTNVRLVRHQDTRLPDRPTPYQLWLSGDGRLNLYQRIQRRKVFGNAQTLAVFVATPLNETLFVGLYQVAGIGLAAPGLIDPISNADAGGLTLYDLALSPKMADYRGRLILEWGLGYRSWVQLAHKQEKAVIEIRRSVGDPPFPGFLDFRVRLSQLVGVPASWRTALSAVGGIYLLVDHATGKQYVGSAQGVGGLWSRWEQYVASGHGGNKRMQGLPAADYQVSVLEVASSSASSELVVKMENRWKQKLLSRTFGLNAN